MSRNPFLTGKAKPIVVGHRGVPLLHQENTLAGFKRALSMGVQAVELDVRLTRDRRAVVVHDHNLRRLTGSSYDVDHLRWDQIAKLRVRKQLPMGRDSGGHQVIREYETEERIPLLAEVLSELAGKIAVNIELKFDMPRWWGIEIAQVVGEVIRKARAEDTVIVTSFDPRKLHALGQANANVAFGFCFDDTMLEFARPLLDRLPRRDDHDLPERGIRANAHRLLNRILESNLVGRILGTRLVGAEHTLVGRDTVKRLHARGIAIGTHTLFPMGSTTTKALSPAAYTEAEVDRLVGIGVDWIESDDPERLLRLIG
ncbi:MAG TPA: glycerophosphodiester phosphodiesterase [Kofleriaceae bacterium]|jgi:glycerophosphoryl diester phosphodiesterase